MANEDPKLKISTPPHPHRSGTHRIDLSSAHEDERVPPETWAALLGCAEGRAELSLAGMAPVQRNLPVEDLDEAIQGALLAWFDVRAVRHWRALRKLHSTSGRTLWKLEVHLASMGEARRDVDTRLRTAAEVERLAHIEMTVFTPRDELRLRAPLVTALATTERKLGSVWLMEDVVLRFHPLLGEARELEDEEIVVEEGFPPESPTEQQRSTLRAPPTEPPEAPTTVPPPEEQTITQVTPGTQFSPVPPGTPPEGVPSPPG